MTLPSSESRSVGNHRIVTMKVCGRSPRSRPMQRTSNQLHTMHTEKMGGQCWKIGGKMWSEKWFKSHFSKWLFQLSYALKSLPKNWMLAHINTPHKWKSFSKYSSQSSSFIVVTFISKWYSKFFIILLTVHWKKYGNLNSELQGEKRKLNNYKVNL